MALSGFMALWARRYFDIALSTTIDAGDAIDSSTSVLYNFEYFSGVSGAQTIFCDGFTWVLFIWVKIRAVEWSLSPAILRNFTKV